MLCVMEIVSLPLRTFAAGLHTIPSEISSRLPWPPMLAM